MSKKMPPVPPENRSPQDADNPDFDPRESPKDMQPPKGKAPNLEQEGRYGNIKQNTRITGRRQAG